MPYNLIPNFFSFLKNPTKNSRKYTNMNALKQTWQIVRLWAFTFLITIVLSIITTQILLAVGIDLENTEEHAVADLLFNVPLGITFLLAVIIGPFVEEISFRLFLRYKNLIWFSLGLGGFVYYMINFFDGFFGFLSSATDWLKTLDLPGIVVAIGFQFGLILILSAIVYSLIKITHQEKNLSELTQKNFTILFWITVFSFGFIHAGNFASIGQFWYLIPVMTLPQIFSGAIWGFVRMKFGFVWAVLYHSFHNFTAFSLTAIFILGGEDLMDKLQNEELMQQFADGDTSVLTQSEITALGVSGVYILFLVAIIFGINIYNLVASFQKNGGEH